MFERFTDRARRVVVLAQDESRLLGHDFIGTEHLLLGLVREGEGVAALVLVKVGAELSRVRQEVIQILAGYGTGASPDQAVPVTDAVLDAPIGGSAVVAGADLLRNALDRLVVRRFTVSSCRVLLLAESEALRLGHSTVGVEHLLLGLLAEEEGRAAGALSAVDVDLVRARALAEESLGRGAAPAQRPGYRDDALDAIEAALHEAFAAEVGHIDTEHLLLGIVHQAEAGPDRASGALGVLGTSPVAVRQAVAALTADAAARDDTPEETTDAIDDTADPDETGSGA